MSASVGTTGPGVCGQPLEFRYPVLDSGAGVAALGEGGLCMGALGYQQALADLMALGTLGAEAQSQAPRTQKTRKRSSVSKGEVAGKGGRSFGDGKGKQGKEREHAERGEKRVKNGQKWYK